MSASSLIYALPGAAWSLRFETEALGTMLQHVQRHFWNKESVGQLYSRSLADKEIGVVKATVLKPLKANWTKVQFDPGAAMREREALFEEGLHCLGIWHTHPEQRPTPSNEDRLLARNHADAANSQLSGVVFVILGTARLPSGLGVWVDDGKSLHTALPIGGYEMSAKP